MLVKIPLSNLLHHPINTLNTSSTSRPANGAAVCSKQARNGGVAALWAKSSTARSAKMALFPLLLKIQVANLPIPSNKHSQHVKHIKTFKWSLCSLQTNQKWWSCGPSRKIFLRLKRILKAIFSVSAQKSNGGPFLPSNKQPHCVRLIERVK